MFFDACFLLNKIRTSYSRPVFVSSVQWRFSHERIFSYFSYIQLCTQEMRRRSDKKKIIFICIFIIGIIILLHLHPEINGRENYQHIAKDFVLENLHEEVTNFSSMAFVDCDYRDAIYEEATMSPEGIEGELGPGILEGGEHIPSDCKPKFSTAVIVPYRDRTEQLHDFLIYMHTFLRKQHIHYRIYVVEQVDTKPFNRAKLLNIGAAIAMKAGFPCLVLHDVDLLPLRLANLYVCTECPRYMSSSVNKFRFVLPYMTIFGGATAILSKQFRAINGMSNKYYGTSGEDEDMYTRLEAYEIKLCRFDKETSLYHMVTHSQEHRGEKRKITLDNAKNRMSTDGLNTLKYTEVATVPHPLFTHIIAELESPY